MVIRYTLKFCWWSAAAVIVALAVALSAARLLLPGMSDYREQIQSLAENVLQRPVSIGSLDAAWHGLSPVLALNDVVVRDERLPDGQLAVAEVQVALDVLGSIFQGSWQTAGVKLIGTELALQTELRNPEQPVNLQAVLDWLLAQESISLEQVALTWYDPGLFEAPVRLTDLSAQLVNAGRRHQLLVESQLPASLGRSVKLAADVRGGDRLSQWRGTLYVRTEAMQLAGFRPAMADTGVEVDGALDLELWMGVDGARPTWGAGELSWLNPAVRNASADAQGVSAGSLDAGLHWRAWADGWRIGVEGFELKRDDAVVWPASDFDVALTLGEAFAVQGQADLLMLDELNAVLPLVPMVDDDALAMLDRIQPRGAMRGAEFEFRQRPDEEPRFALRSRVENLSLAANGGLPGATGLSGVVEGNLQAGFLRLDCRGAELVMPRVFPEQPLPLSSINGMVRWQRYADSFRIETDDLQVCSGALAVDSRWRMDWSYEQAAPWLDLQLAAADLPLTAVPDYLPSGVMSDKAVDWLQHAFEAGSARNIRMLLQGRLDQMPFDAGQGRFEARFDFDDAQLNYHPTWGQLDELSGYAVFSGRSMRITGRSARLLDSPVERVVARIDDLALPMLEIDGTVGGTLAGMLEFVRSSPLQQNFGALVEQLDSSGDARLQLALSIPLKASLGRIAVDGDLLLAGNELQPKNSEVVLSDIEGALHFTRDALSVDQAKARLFGHPVAINVYRRGDTGHSSTVVDIQGRFGLIERLKREQPSLSPYLSGDAHWRALLDIQNQAVAGSPRLKLNVESDLNGVVSSLPPPFAKTADERRDFRISWTPGGEGVYPLRAVYEDTVDAAFMLNSHGRGVRRGTVSFGTKRAELPQGDEIRIVGHLPLVEFDRWLPLLAGGDGGRGTMPPPALDLGTDRFRFAGMQVDAIRASSEAADPWLFQVEGDVAEGHVRWIKPSATRASRLLVDLKRLHMDSATGEEMSAARSASTAADELPELNVKVRDLHWGERDLGAIEVVSRRVADGTQFDTLNMNAEAVVFTGEGLWRGQGDQATSRFSARVDGGELEKLAALFGAGSGVNGGKLTGSVKMSWPGSPVDFRLADLEGDFDLKARDGRLASVDEGPGKLLSLFSLNSLQRRLNLDFRDLVKEGFSFDKMHGHFVVMDGDAFTDDFTIEGTSVSIEIAGRTGLMARDYDQLVTVTPHVTSTLPIAGAIAGGPAVGAAVFLADKLVGDRFNRLTQIQYQVTGSWDEPVYTRLKKDAPAPPPEDTDPYDN